MVKLNRIHGKTEEERLQYLNSLPYDVLLRRKKGRFYLFIPELSLVGVGDSLTQAYNDLSEQKQKFFNKILSCEAEDEIALPRKIYKRNQMFEQLKLFISKLLIICFLLGATLVFSAIAIKHSTSGTYIAKKAINSVIVETERFFIAPEYVKQKRMKKLRQFLEAIRPMVDEFKIVFSSSYAGKEVKDK